MYYLYAVTGMIASLFILFDSWGQVMANNALVFLIFVGIMLFVTNAALVQKEFKTKRHPLSDQALPALTLILAVWLAT